MTVHCAHRFVLDVRALGGDVLFTEALEPDWEPARQGARLNGLRTRGVWHDGDAESLLAPVWQASAPPFVHMLRVRMRAAGHEWCTDFKASEYFADAASAVVAARLASGQLAPGDRVRFAVAAYPVDQARPDGLRSRLSVVDRPQPLAPKKRDFSALAGRAIACGDTDPSDVEVVLPESVVEDICHRTKTAGARETGGILIGHLCCDEDRGDVGLEVTAHIPARHTVSEREKLTFTSDTWTDVRNAVALRKAGELLLGWWHSHPAFSWCARCPVDRQRVCRLATGFLSADDKALHRSIFPSAFTQALVVTHSVGGLDTRLFGWRNGVLKSRGFRLCRDIHSEPSLALSSVQQAASVVEAACTNQPREVGDAQVTASR